MKYCPKIKGKYFIIIYLVITSQWAASQSFVYYPFNSVLGIGTNPEKTVWLDIKLQTNSYFSSLSSEFSPQFTFKKKPRALYYAGAGLKLNYLNAIDNRNILEGYFINSGVRIKPFGSNKKVHLAFELSPYVSRKMDIGVFRSMLGIGYNFSGIKQ